MILSINSFIIGYTDRRRQNDYENTIYDAQETNGIYIFKIYLNINFSSFQKVNSSITTSIHHNVIDMVVLVVIAVVVAIDIIIIITTMQMNIMKIVI